MYGSANTTKKQYTEYFEPSIEGNVTLQNQAQNDDYDWTNNWDWNESYSINNTDDSPLTIEDSLNLHLGLTRKEKDLIDEFYKELKDISEKNCRIYTATPYDSAGSRLKNNFEHVDSLIDKYLKKGIKLNVFCDGYENTVANSIFEELVNIVSRVIEITPTTRSRLDPDTGEDALNELTDTDNFDFLVSIINKLLLAGANILYSDRRICEVMWGNDKSTLAKLEEIKNTLKSEAYKSIVNSNKQPEDLKVEIDNTHLFIEYPKNSIIEVAKVTNSKISQDLNVKESILKIRDNLVKVEKVGRKRNYMDVVGSGIIISIPTAIGKINIHLCPDEADNNKVKVKLDEESQDKIDQLPDKSTIDEIFLLGGKSISEAVKDGNFERNGNVPTKLSETIEQSNNEEEKKKAPSSFVEKIHSVKKSFSFCGSSLGKI